MYDVVSSSTPSYYPGIIALWNSIRISSPKCNLTVYCFDDTNEYKELEKSGIKVLLNKEMPGPLVDKGKMRPNCGIIGDDMYARLLISSDFTGRAFYVDADCLILNPIYELWDTLDLAGYPTACVYRPDIGWKGGDVQDEMASGTFLADTDKWREIQLEEAFFNIMKNYGKGNISRIFSVNVESVLSYAHQHKFLHLHPMYQNLTYYGGLSKEVKVAHFASFKPWNPAKNKKLSKINYNQLWQAYYNLDIEKIKIIENSLPEKSPVVNTANARKLRQTQNKWC